MKTSSWRSFRWRLPPPWASRRARQRRPVTAGSPMDDVAERYVQLVLALGQHDADYVDAYYGPPEWKQQAEARKVPLADLAAQAKTLLGAIDAVPGQRTRWSGCASTTWSGSSLRSRPASACSRASACRSTRSRRRSTTPWRRTLPESHFQEILDQLDQQFPGDGPLRRPLRDVPQRAFVIPREKLDAVFQAAIGHAASGRCSTQAARGENASRSSTSPTSRGAATTGIRATSAA